MLDTRFPRPPGDIGNAQTYARAGIPARFLTVAGASPQRVVVEADAALLAPFITAARELAAQGATMITTSCGFLAAHQAALAAAVPVPLISSSLLQCASLRRPGIVTIDAAALGSAVLRGASVPPGTPIEGVTPGCEFQRRLIGNDTVLDFTESERNVVDAARRLVARHPEVQHIVLECTNMPPYREVVAAATGREVRDLETLLIEAWGGCNRAES